MITDIIVVYNDISQINNLGSTLNSTPYFTFINEKKDKKKSWTIRNEWGAKKLPFIICLDKDRPIKVFYSEAEENIIESLNTYLNGENICS